MATIVGLFETREEARRAIEALRRAGLGDSDIGVVMRDDRGGAAGHEEAKEGEGASAAVGAFGGGVIGGLSGLALGLTGLLVPGIGPALVAGPLAGLLGGSALGAATGGLLGSLTDLGVPEDEARLYQAGVGRGGVLVSVNVTEGRAGFVRTLLEQNGLRDIHEQASRWEGETAAAASHPASEDQTEADKAEQEGIVTAGGAAGGVLGGVAGAFIGGPVGAAIGAAIGMATGAMAGSLFDYDTAEAEFRDEWERSPDRERIPWAQASAAHRYGWEGHERSEPASQAARTWDEARTHLERGWGGGGNWSEYEAIVRSGWERRARMRPRDEPSERVDRPK
jgi:uncharacterized membrane protein